LLSDFRELILYLGLYIHTDLFPSVQEPSGFPIFLDIFRMALPVLLQVVRVLAQPFFHPGVIVLAAVGIFSSPVGIVLGLERFFTGRTCAGLLAPAHRGMGSEGFITVGAL
jgi:hypothetical protein